MGAERDRVAGFGRLENGLLQAGEWYRWGPYVSERQWGTVREDYSADGEAWDYLPHDHARSRAYRWGEDGLAGFCDVEQRLCLGLALWNGKDPILKERAFGLTGAQGNHGEDVKEYWWYLDALPSHAWNRWRYHYPQGPFPYQDLIDTNGARNREEPEYELLDTGAFDDDRYWITEVHYAKASADDLLMTVQVTNAGPETATLHVLPTAWFRNTWSWDVGAPKPEMRAVGDSAVGIDHPFVGPLELLAGPAPDGTLPTALFCENETNDQRLFGSAPLTPYPKDGINDHVVSGAATVNPGRTGTKCSFWYQLTVQPGQTAEVRLRLRTPPAKAPRGTADDPLGAQYSQVVAQRQAEADEFYAELTPAGASADEALVMRQAFAGLLWSKQLFYYDVARWLDGDPTQPAPPAQRLTGRNSRWRNFDAFDIMSMPDKWEYPWFAAWDLAFHCVALAHVDPAFAKYQLILLCREWFQHPNGALPAYEWDFGDVNPPVQAWAAAEVFAIDGARDIDFVSRIFDKLLVNFTWWVNREDSEGNNLFEGGFLGLDNIGPIDRSHLPVGGILEQSDATGWMGFYAIAMASMAIILNRSGQRPGIDLILKFLEHFAGISEALEGLGLWDETDGLYYDRLLTPSGDAVSVKVRSMVGIIPILAAAVIEEDDLQTALTVGKQFAEFMDRHAWPTGKNSPRAACCAESRASSGCCSAWPASAGSRSCSRSCSTPTSSCPRMACGPCRPTTATIRTCSTSKASRPASTTSRPNPPPPCSAGTPTGAARSGSRSTTWSSAPWSATTGSSATSSPSSTRPGRACGSPWTRSPPTCRTGSSRSSPDGPEGRRPCFGGTERMQHDPAWHDNLIFSEYFHGDNGAAIGAFHQTGWTGLIADMIRRRHGAVDPIGDVIRAMGREAGQ